jgi:LmbE family N-acetylglucosaminyl deacetylase
VSSVRPPPFQRLHPGERIGVLAPHPDDAVLSLGATLAQATRAGCPVCVVSVFGSDPARARPAGEWDRKCGFGISAQAAVERAAEDRGACDLLGARSVQLPFDDDQYAPEREADVIWPAIARALGAVDMVMIPGAPLLHPDHRWVTELALARLPGTIRLGFYVDQPYAMWEALAARNPRQRLRVRLEQACRTAQARRRQEPVMPNDLSARVGRLRWDTSTTGRGAWLVKLRAMYRYRSQLRGFGPDFVPQILLYEWASGGERVAWRPSAR